MLEASTERKLIFVGSLLFLGSTEVGTDGVVLFTVDVKLWGLNHLAFLDIVSANLHKIASVSIVAGDKLRHDCEGLGGVNSKAGAFAKEGLVPKAICIQITAWPVTKAALATIFFILAAFGAVEAARMSGVRSSLTVGFPNIHLRTTRTIFSHC